MPLHLSRDNITWAAKSKVQEVSNCFLKIAHMHASFPDYRNAVNHSFPASD